MLKFGLSTYRYSSNPLKNLRLKKILLSLLQKNTINSDKCLKMISQNGSSGYWRRSGNNKIRKVNEIKERQHDEWPVTKWKAKATAYT